MATVWGVPNFRIFTVLNLPEPLSHKQTPIPTPIPTTPPPDLWTMGLKHLNTFSVFPTNLIQGSWVRYPVWQHTFVSPSAFSRRAIVSYWQKYVHKVLVNRLGGLSLPRKSVVRLTDRPDMTLDVYRGRKTTIQYNTIQTLSITFSAFISWLRPFSLLRPSNCLYKPFMCSGFALR